MRTVILLTGFLLLACPVRAEDEDPVLVTKHAACFVHAVSAWPARDGNVERVAGPGHALLHTDRETGKMKRLLPATGTVMINTRRPSYLVTRILGVTADEDRLYVLLWRSGRIFDRPPAAGAALEEGRYELRVFWLADGSELAGESLGPDGLPRTAPEASLKTGPLERIADGVRCFGTKVRYAGRERRRD